MQFFNAILSGFFYRLDEIGRRISIKPTQCEYSMNIFLYST